MNQPTKLIQKLKQEIKSDNYRGSNREKFNIAIAILAKWRIWTYPISHFKGFPPWPAKITDIGAKDKYNVYFYGTYETAVLKHTDIFDITKENQDKFIAKNEKSYSNNKERNLKTSRKKNLVIK